MRSVRRVVAAVIALACELGLMTGVAAATPPTPPTQPTANVSGFARPHAALPADPLVVSGEPLLVVVTGFASRATVSVRVVASQFARHPHADRNGVVRLAYVVGSNLAAGQHLMTFEGTPPVQAGPGEVIPDRGSRLPRAADPQAITATVPTIGLFPFRLGKMSSSAGERPARHAPDEGSGSNLSDTGVDIGELLLVALIAGSAGATALRLGRRCREAPSSEAPRRR